MKTFLFTILLAAGLSQLSLAQEVGVRFGDAVGGHYAVDAVLGLAGYSRVHADVSFGNSGVGIEALANFMGEQIGSGFTWYAGLGPYTYLGDPFLLGLSAEIGLEYHFNFPIAAGIDYRPSLELIDDVEFHGGWFGVNVRYVFGK